MTSLRGYLFSILAVLLLPVTGLGQDGNEPSREDQVKAAFLYKFLNFIEWEAPPPSDPAAVRAICVLGHPELADVITRLITLQEGGEIKTTVRLLTQVAESESCSVLFMSRAEAPLFEDHLLKMQGKRILTVSDVPRFAQRGGIIQLVRDGRNIRFIINNSKAKSEGIKISAQLLALAKEIIEEPHAI